MITAAVVLVCAALVVACGEAVRAQCRRMLSRPVAGSTFGPSVVRLAGSPQLTPPAAHPAHATQIPAGADAA